MVSEKYLFLIGDININLLDYKSNNIVKNLFNASFKHGMFPVIIRPRVTRHSSVVIDHILTNAILTKNIYSGIVKRDISDHFPIFSYIDEEIILDRKGEPTIFKRKINDQFILTFKNILSICHWEALYTENYPDIAYNKLLKVFSKVYDSSFPKIQKIKVKTIPLLNPWISKGVKRNLRKTSKTFRKILEKAD